VWGWGTSRSALISLQSKVLRLMPPPLTQPRSDAVRWQYGLRPMKRGGLNCYSKNVRSSLLVL
jgi:hypothetical protein